MVTCKFDAEELYGKKNPITGERLISCESIAAFMKKYNLNNETLTLITKNFVLKYNSDK